MCTEHERFVAVSRRHFLKKSTTGLGTVALTALLNDKLPASTPVSVPDNPLMPRPPHFPSRAKAVIYMHMEGAPSNLDLFEQKPVLNKYHMKQCPEEMLQGERFAFIKGVPNLLGCPHAYKTWGQSGQVISELLPHLGGIADDIAIVRSLHTDEFNHGPAELFLQTGSARLGRPSMGSWITYGLGSISQDLPGFVVLISGKWNPSGGTALWASGFLPSVYQGAHFRNGADPVLFVNNPAGMDRQLRRSSLDALRTMNEMELDEYQDPEIATRIASYELAYRMQTSVPELTDLTTESQSTLDMYGAVPGEQSYANNCLLARRLVERGVRFVQLYHADWDHHGNSRDRDIRYDLPRLCKETDRASAALVADLKQRGLLEETLVVWGGEFGRTPMNEERDGSPWWGRDHNPHAFTMWMAGGGIKSGISYGETDELGYRAAVNPVHVHDLQATMLHCLGLNHKQLTYRFQGRDFRLTDVFGKVVTGLCT